ncbi:MAG: hypothetical protein AAF443_00300 [Chlamydiota bacterium]
MHAKKVWPYFFLALCFELTNPTAFTPLRLFFFAPFFAIAYSVLSKKKALIIATIIGLMLDTLSADAPFGCYTFAHVLVTLLLYRWRLYFVDHLIGLCSFTFVFSMAITAIERLLLCCFNTALPLTASGFFSDFLLLPLADSCYALICFWLPAALYEQLKKMWFRFLFFVKTSKNKNSHKKRSSSLL